MPVLDEALIRKRAEHNDGILPDLEEISLHQQEIEKIENIDRCCRHIKILLLQNNCIGRIENVTKLKELEYLNLALNNISLIEGLEGCESLNKLDMTVNFVDTEDFSESMNNLKANVMLQDLYLVGNPCTDLEFYRPYVCASLPMLKQLDGKLINPTERILARQKLNEYEEKLKELAQANILKKEQQKASGFKAGECAHTKENRLDMSRELAAQKEEKDLQERKRLGTEPKPLREIPEPYNAKGEIRQCNEGKYDFLLDDESDPKNLIFELSVPRFLDTSRLSVDVNPLYVRVVAKEKLTQLRLPEEVIVSTSKVQRSKTTGWLKITMPRLAPKASRHKANRSIEIEPLREKDVTTKAKPKAAPKGPADVAHIVAKPEMHLQEVKKSIVPPIPDEYPDVPPLEPIPNLCY
eukprot:GEMP01029800.1.p1 GENE.GEMP01029800.1~~GEMP01029800.1.p1  ORF type:complete len:425 (+),score=96.85 GEMP01029800.1:46-1275(+)